MKIALESKESVGVGVSLQCMSHVTRAKRAKKRVGVMKFNSLKRFVAVCMESHGKRPVVAGDKPVAEVPSDEFFKIDSLFFVNLACILQVWVHPRMARVISGKFFAVPAASVMMISNAEVDFVPPDLR